jgi:hypothetical protein
VDHGRQIYSPYSTTSMEGPELNEREGFPRPKCHIGKFSAVHGGALSRSMKQLSCDGAPMGLGLKVLLGGGDQERKTLCCIRMARASL